MKWQINLNTIDVKKIEPIKNSIINNINDRIKI
jgi:hypothetical protein